MNEWVNIKTLLSSTGHMCLMLDAGCSVQYADILVDNESGERDVADVYRERTEVGVEAGSAGMSVAGVGDGTRGEARTGAWGGGGGGEQGGQRITGGWSSRDRLGGRGEGNG